jgi:protein-S-isoprenylcysteine O-methyltransferase Ste14
MGGWLLDLLGVALIIAGIGLNVRGSGQFERAGTPVRPGSRGGALVTDGVFSFSRNPMYLGMVAILLGVAIGLGSTWALLAPSMFMGLIQTRFIRMEERILEEEFGAAYVAYRKRVGRWIGRGAWAL